MAGRPKKRLLDYVQQGTFRAREDGHLLGDSADLPYEGLAALQRQYRGAGSDPERRAIALNFERLIRWSHDQLGEEAFPVAALEETLLELGPPGSFEQVEAFFPRFFRHYQARSSAGKPFKLAPFQRDFLREFWRRDKHGKRVYQVGLLGIPKSNGKTPLAAGLGLYTLVSDPNSPDVFGVAGSKQQAGLARDFARRWAEDGELAEWVVPGNSLTCAATHGRYRILSSDGRLGQGVSPSAAIVDEWWLFATAREREAYVALAQALGKREGDSWLLAITTAGWNKKSQLGETFESAIKNPRLEVHRDGYLLILRNTKAGFLMHWYGLPEDKAATADIEDPKVIRACNPAPWVSTRSLIRELHRDDTDEYDWRRLHLNQWTASRDAWIAPATWARLGCDLKPPEGASLYVGVDIGWTRDSSAIAWAWRHEDGRILVQTHVWTVDPDDPVLRLARRGRAKTITYVPGGRMQLDLVADKIRELRDHYRIRELCYDPNLFGDRAQQLEREGVVTVEFLPNGKPMWAAWQAFYQGVQEGQLAHSWDPVFAAHVEAAAADRTEAGWRVRKLKSSNRIDALAAAVMAYARCDICTRAGDDAPQIFWL